MKKKILIKVIIIQELIVVVLLEVESKAEIKVIGKKIF